MENNEPIFGHGKICYVEIPSNNIEASAAFYGTVFGWKIDRRSDGTVTFDDAVGCVSGMWVSDRPVSANPGIMISIMVDDAARTLTDIVAGGGKIIEPVGKYLPVITAVFSDPTGNLWTIYQHNS